MKKLMIGAAVTCLGLAMTGCIAVNQNDGGIACRRPCIAKDIVHEKFTVATNAVSAQDQMNCLFGFITWGSTATHTADAVCCGENSQFPFSFPPTAKALFFLSLTEKAKNGAYANACDAAKCDQIVGAKYKVTKEDYFVFQKVKVEITGYPATLSGVEIIENTKPCCCK